MAQLAHHSRPMPPGPAQRARFQAVIAFALAICVLALGAFAFLAHEVLAKALVGANQDALMAIHAYASPTYDPVMVGLTTIGSPEALLVLGLLLGGGLLAKRRPVDAGSLWAVVVGSAALTEAFKHVFHQARPALFQQIVQEHGYSFPSGHSTLSFALFGFLAAWLLVDAPRRAIHWVGALFCVVLACGVAFSRVYLGVHWPTDVAGGMLLGISWAAACLAGRQFVVARAGAAE